MILDMSKSRIQQINEHLLQNVQTIYRLRKIQIDIVDGKQHVAFVLSFTKTGNLTLEEAATVFYRQLLNILNEEETLSTENKSFRICSRDFCLTYCLEAWRKTADKRVYIDNGEVVIEPLGRMSCEQAAAVFKKHNVDPLPLISTLETLQRHDNPADKYVALAKLPLFLTSPKATIRVN